MAFSSLRLNQELFDKINSIKITVEDHEFTFCRAEDEILKEISERERGKAADSIQEQTFKAGEADTGVLRTKG